MQKYDDNGQEIKYSARETTVPKFYQVIYDENTPLTITNKFIGSQETIVLKVKKHWDEHKNKIAIPIIKHAQSILPSQYHVNKETTTTIHDTFVLFATACPNKKAHTYL